MKAKSKCRTGKFCFRTEFDAIIRMKLWIVHKESKAIPVRAYRCPMCKHWHLTSKK